MRGGGKPGHLPRGPAPAGRQKAFGERLLELEGYGALAQADVLPGQSLPGQHRGVARTRRDDPRRQQPHAGRSHDAEEDWQPAHVIAVRRRMMTFPIPSMTAAIASMNQPNGLVNIGRK